ncbi:MAG: hypothetical protein ACI9QD_000434, partial [Thermoproteota archaeon]
MSFSLSLPISIKRRRINSLGKTMKANTLTNFLARLLSFCMTIMIATSLTFFNCGSAYAQAKTKATAEDNEEKTMKKKVGDMAKETAKSVAKQAAKQIAIGVAKSVARQAAEASGSFGIGAALGAAKKAIVVVEQAATAASALKAAGVIKKGASALPLITAIIFGLVGITSIIKCKKSDIPIVSLGGGVATNVPAPSFYLWTVSSIAFMVSEVVTFIKFKRMAKELTNQALNDEQKEQKEALMQQREILQESLKTAEMKLTWTRIVNAGYIGASVAALAELIIQIATERDVMFVMKCDKEEDKDKEGAGDGEKAAPEKTSFGSKLNQNVDMGKIGADAGKGVANGASGFIVDETTEHTANAIAGKTGLESDKE